MSKEKKDHEEEEEGEDDWEKWAEDDAPDPLEEKAKVDQQAKEELTIKKATQKQGQEEQAQKQAQEQKALSQAQKAQQLSQAADVDNILDMFDGERPKQKKVGQADLKKIGDNFALAIANVGPVYVTDFLKNLITKMENKLVLENWEEIHKVVDVIYQKKKKQHEKEEELKNKHKKETVPKGIAWGKTKNLQNQMDSDDDIGGAGDDDDFM